MNRILTCLLMFVFLGAIEGTELERVDLKLVGTILGEESSEVFFKTVPPIAVDEEGMIYLADNFRHAVFKVDQEGKLIKRIGKQGQGPGDIAFPVCLRVRNSKLVVKDGHAISFFNLDGSFISKFKNFAPVLTFDVRDSMVAFSVPTLKKMVAITNLQGKLLGSFFERPYEARYELFAGRSNASVDLNMFKADVWLGDQKLCWVSHAFGDVFQMDMQGKLLNKIEINIDKKTKKELIDFYYQKGYPVRASARGRNQKFPIDEKGGAKFSPTYYLRSSFYYKDKLYLLKECVEGDNGFIRENHLEIIEVDMSSLQIKRVLIVSERKGKPFNMRATWFAVADLAGERYFFIPVYDIESGEIYIGKYK